MKKGKANQYTDNDTETETEWKYLLSTFLLDNKQFLLADTIGNKLLSNIAKGITKSQKPVSSQESFEGVGLIARKLIKGHNEETMKASMKTFFKPFEKILTTSSTENGVASPNRNYKVNQKIVGMGDRSSSQEGEDEP